MFEIDTGAGVCIIPKALVTLFKPEHCPELKSCNMRLQLANGQQSDIIGTVQLGVVTSANQRMRPISTTFYVVDGPHALIGRPLMRVLFPGLYEQIRQLSKAINCFHGDEKYIQVPTTMVVAKNDLISRNQGIGVATECNRTDGSSTESDGSSSGNIVPAIPTPAIPSTDTPTVVTVPLCANLPDAPTGEVSQEEGNRFCKLIARAHPTLFDGKQGTAKGFKAKIHLKPGAESKLKVLRPAKVAIGISPQYNVQLDKMEETGIYVSGVGLKVASQVVPVVQKNAKEIKVRNCVNYKNTINPLIEDEPYNFPTTNEQIDKLKGEYYTCLDINGAFTHIELEEETQDLLTYSTHRGFIKPTRLPFGVKTAPAIFQSYMDKLLAGIPSCACIVDDICVTGNTPSEHFRNLESVLHRLEEAGMKLNNSKCQFYLPSVKYLGRIISRDGQKMDPSAVDAILNMPAPTSKHELQSFLGYLSYVRRHVPDLSRVTPVLSALLKKNVNFIWNEEHETAFQQCKKLAGNMATLTHFDEKKEIVLTTDASPVGIGACLSHKFVEGNKSYLKPIAYASRSLTPAERNYAQIEREGLAVHWAVKYFRQFLYCRHFTLQTDCSALTKIFGPKNDLGGCALSRINRWCVDLMEYDFTAQHIKGNKNLVCDGLSRLPQPSTNSLLIEDNGCGLSGRTTEEFIHASVKCLSVLPVVGTELHCYKSEGVANLALQVLPLTASDIAKATREDPLYGRVLTAVKTGVFDVKDKTLSPFTNMKDKLTVDAGCLLFGSRVIIPTCQQARLLFELHITHMGVVKMKSLAREYIWWPGINKEIESMAAKCTGCAKYKKKPAPVPLTHWPWATRPMERLHVDFGDYKGTQLLIVIDAFSKYIWTYVMGKDTTTPRLLRQLDSIFAERGLPTIIVSDNGPQFTSHLFAEHMKSKKIKHVLTPPYHPPSNGMAEVAVGIIKKSLYKMDVSADIPTLQNAITAILFQHRQTPTTSTGRTPFEMMDYNKVQTPLSLLRPTLHRRNECLQQQRVSNRDGVTSNSLRTFTVGQNVLVYNTLSRTNEIGKVVELKGKNVYNVTINGKTKLVSADVMSKCDIDSEQDIDPVNDSDSESVYGNIDNDDPSGGSIAEIESAYSDDDDIDVHPGDNIYVIPQRRQRRTEAEKLHDSLSSAPVVSRTRSGRI